MPALPHVFSYREARPGQRRVETYLVTASILVGALWLSFVTSPGGENFSRQAFMFSLALAALSLAAAISLKGPGPVAPAKAPEAVASPQEMDLLQFLRQELHEARHKKHGVALLIMGLDQGSSQGDSVRRQQEQARMERSMKTYAPVDYRLFRLGDARLALAVSGADALAKLLDLADRLQRVHRESSGGGDSRFDESHLTFGVGADHNARGTAEGLLWTTKVALQRAENLNTGRYIILEEVTAD